MRLFIAIEFNDDIITSLKGIQQNLKSCGLKGRYTREENLHLTLAFIGDYGSPDEYDDIKKIKDNVTYVSPSNIFSYNNMKPDFGW
jgi:2'-5' RNA ligase